MDSAAYLEQLAADGTRLAAAASQVDWDAPVPGIDWSVREVVVHTGSVHRWAADIVRRRLRSNETGGSAAFQPGLPDDEVPDWFTEGLTALITTLEATPDDAEAWMFGAQVPVLPAWSRRQAHETAIHRVDVEAAAGGDITAFGAGFAQDGLAELATFAAGFEAAGTGRLGLLATDGPDWLVTFGAGRIRAEPGDATAADATVSGTSSELYRWAWNRPSPVVVEGDAAVAAHWRGVRIT